MKEMIMKDEEYIEAKTKSVSRHTNKALWYDQKIAEYVSKAKEERSRAKNDTRIIEMIQALQLNRSEAEKRKEKLIRLLASPEVGGDDVEDTLAEIAEIDASIVKINEDIRGEYYGKRTRVETEATGA